MEIIIEQLKMISLDDIANINDLLSQLNPDSKPLSDDDVREIIGVPSARFLVARDSISQKIIGMMILVIYRIPAWKKGWIEDLVVDKNYRGKGIATKLIKRAIEDAKADGVMSLNLTSRPERKDANKLYIKFGFQKRETNTYRLEL